MSNSIVKEIFVYSVGSFGSKILSFLLIPLYTFFLTKENLGEYDLITTTVALFVPLISLQITDSVYRWFISDEEIYNDYIHKQKVFTNALFLWLISFFLFLIIFVFFFRDYKFFVYFIGLIFVNSLLPLLQSVLRGLKKTKEFAVSGMFTTFLMVVLNFIFIYIVKLKVEGILIANILSYVISIFSIFFYYKFYRLINITGIDKKLMIEMLKYSLPLIPNLMSWWLINSASKFIIFNSLGVDANGIYAVSSRFPSILIIVNSVLILPIQDAYLSGKYTFEEFKKLVNKFIYFELIVVFLLSLGAPIYVRILIDKIFYESWIYMALLYLGVCFNTVGALVSLVFQKEKDTFKITVTTFIGGIISIVLAFLLVEIYKLQAISFSFLIGYLVMLVLRLYYVKGKYDFEINYFSHLVFIFIFLTFAYIQSKVNFFNQLCVFIFSLILVIMFKKKSIINLIKKYIC